MVQPLFGFLPSYIISKMFYIDKIACDLLYKIRLILWVMALLGIFDVIFAAILDLLKI